MPQEKSITNRRHRANKLTQQHSYELHIAAAHAPGQNHGSRDKQGHQDHQSKQGHHGGHQGHHGGHQSHRDKQMTDVATPNANRSGTKSMTRLWRTLEWLATSALIFLALFFAINFSSYSQLIMLKLEHLRGEVKQNPFIQELLAPSAQKPLQKLLPATAGVKQSKKQLPALALGIAPPDDRIIIPRINKNVPIVNVSPQNLVSRDWNALEKDIQEALKGGVVHYPGTAQPGDRGNVVVTGHSSYFPWDPGRFKDVFALLHEVAIGDTIILYHNQKQYQYAVYDVKIITPDKIEVLTQEGDERLTLITCTPIGTNLKRLIVLAKPLSV